MSTCGWAWTGPSVSERTYVFRETTVLLSRPDRPTVLVCGNDEMAMQAHLAAPTLGLRIPEDVSIAGFDDFRTIYSR